MAASDVADALPPRPGWMRNALCRERPAVEFVLSATGDALDRLERRCAELEGKLEALVMRSGRDSADMRQAMGGRSYQRAPEQPQGGCSGSAAEASEEAKMRRFVAAVALGALPACGGGDRITVTSLATQAGVYGPSHRGREDPARAWRPGGGGMHPLRRQGNHPHLPHELRPGRSQQHRQGVRWHRRPR